MVSMLSDGYQDDCQSSIEKLLKEMLEFIFYQFDFLRWGFGTKPFDEKHVVRLRHIMKHTISESEVHMGLTDLAAELNITVQHLIRDIKEKFGKTFQELLCYSKCERAAKLLISTNRRILDITTDCGFSDPKYLIKYFRRIFNCTPSEFRKTHQADKSTLALQVKYRDLPLDRAISRLTNACAQVPIEKNILLY